MIAAAILPILTWVVGMGLGFWLGRHALARYRRRQDDRWAKLHDEAAAALEADRAILEAVLDELRSARLEGRALFHDMAKDPR